MSSSDGHWSYYEYADDDSLTKRWRADTGAGTYFEYDKTGSCEKIVSPAGVTYFEYTHANLVSRMVELGGSDFQFGYDGSGTRYAIVEDGVSTYYLWDDLRLMETRNADYTLKARFAHGPARVEGIGTCVEVYRASDGKRYYMLYDHRGSAHVVLDESKSVVATRLYNAFGEIISSTGTWPAEVPFGYQTNWLAIPGMTLPDGTQVYHTETRVYVPPDGRFLQRDFRRRPGENAYVYAANNPVNLVDPTGMYSIADLAGMCGDELEQALKEMSPLELFKALRWLTDRLVRDRGGTDSEGYKKRLGLLGAVEKELNTKTGTKTDLAGRLSKNQDLGRRGRRHVRGLLGAAIKATGKRKLDRDLIRQLTRDTNAFLKIWASPERIEALNRMEAQYLARLEMATALTKELALGSSGKEQKAALTQLADLISKGATLYGAGGVAAAKVSARLAQLLKAGKLAKVGTVVGGAGVVAEFVALAIDMNRGMRRGERVRRGLEVAVTSELAILGMMGVPVVGELAIAYGVIKVGGEKLMEWEASEYQRKGTLASYTRLYEKLGEKGSEFELPGLPAELRMKPLELRPPSVFEPKRDVPIYNPWMPYEWNYRQGYR